MDAFLARQPILDRQGNVFAYELLYRAGRENHAGEAPGERATANVLLNAFGTFGLDEVTGGKRAFINLTRELLISDYAQILPADRVVLEILEVVEPDAEVMAAARTLVAKGYTLALDDFVYDARFHDLLGIAEIVKVDLMALSTSALTAQVDALAPYRRRLIAEKVESPAQYESVYGLGFDYFQGYYFSRPVVMTARRLPAASLLVMRSMREVLAARHHDELQTIIMADLSLSYRLLRLINSAAFGLRHEVGSIRHALALLGVVTVKKWLSLILLTEVGTDKTPELLRLALTRAKMLECLSAAGDPDGRAQAFTIGLFSTIDAFLDLPMADALEPLHFSTESCEALLHHKGTFGALLALAIAYERGDWTAVGDHAARLGLSNDAITAAYLQALAGAEETVDTGL